MPDKRQKKQTDVGLGKYILEILFIFAVMVGLYYFLFTFVFSNETVSGPSMQPTFQNRDRLVAVRHFNLRRNEIVIFKAPDHPNVLYIKRIIGLPGEKVSSYNDQLYINGKKTAEPYLNNHFRSAAHQHKELYTNNFTLRKRVPKNSYFVLGDHRDISKDSRYFGFVSKNNIVGEVKWRYWPLNEWRTF